MNRKYHVPLTEEEGVLLQKQQSDAKTPKSIQKRCSVLLMSDENAKKPPSQEKISIRCGVPDVTVYSLIKDCNRHGVLYCLRRRNHKAPPHPPIVTGEKEARIVALACGSAHEGRSR